MLVQDNPAAARELISRANAYNIAAHPRAEGLHVSDLIYCRRKSWYRRQARAQGFEGEEYDTDTLVMFLLGHGYHALLEQGIEERKVILHFGPFAANNNRGLEVHGTIDGEVRPDGSPHEFKTTRYSSNKSIEEMIHYVEQVATYALGLDMTHAQLSIIFINGSYNKGGTGMKPTIKTLDLDFTEAEMAAWYLELDRRIDALLQPTPPPLPCHRTWECQYCPFSWKKGGPCEGGPGEQRHWFMQDQVVPDFVDDVLAEV
jgi:CRISPR/Cas system-associated exonuclease Cas4 (RecB family)